MRAKEAVLRKAPSYTFGTRNETHLLGDAGPGPGDYSTPVSPSNSKHTRGPAPTFGFGRFTSLKQTSPGPGHFDPRHIGPHHPAPSFHGSISAQPRSALPGPGAFSPDRAYKLCKPASPGFTIPAKFEGPGCKQRTPGPGDYHCSLPDSAAQRAVTLKFRHEEGKGSREAAVLFAAPGPGAFSPSIDDKRRIGPAFTMGKRLEHKEHMDSFPGPGAYE